MYQIVGRLVELKEVIKLIVLRDFMIATFLFVTAAYASSQSHIYAALTSFIAFYSFISWRTYVYDVERSNEGSEREEEMDV